MQDRLTLQAQRSPDTIALRGGNLQLSYEELRVEVEAFCATLSSASPKVIGLLMDNGPAWVVADLAALALSTPIIPLPAFFSHAQLEHAMRAAGVDTLVCDQADRVEEWLSQCGIQIVAETHRRAANQVLTVFQLAMTPQHTMPAGTAKITFTSGTTAQPKGVCLAKSTLLTVAESLANATEANEQDHHLCILPLSTLLENIAGLYVPLWVGAKVTVLPLAEVGLSGSSGFDVQAFMRTLSSHQPTTLILTPELLLALVSALEAGMPRISSLRFVAVGGASVSPQLLVRAQVIGLPVYEGYGLSECGSVVTLNTAQSHQRGTVGKPLSHVRVTLSEQGEVCVHGPSMLGYLGDTAVPATSDGIATGDLGAIDANGYVVITGRIKHIFITSFGRNVSPEWIERELTVQGSIRQAAVFGEAMPINTAVIVPSSTATEASIARAIEETNARLPDYARVGRWLIADQAFLPQNGLLTANGRLRRSAIWQQYQTRIQQHFTQQDSIYAIL